MPLLRALLVHHNMDFRSCVARVLREDKRFLVVGETADGRQAIALAAQLKPDMIVLDSELSQPNGYDFALQIRELCPGAALIFLSGNESAAIMRATLSIGVLSYIVKGSDATDRTVAGSAVLARGRFVSPKRNCLLTDLKAGRPDRNAN